MEPEAEPQPEPDPDPIFVAPETMYPAVSESLGFEELYATVPELSAEERLARRKRYRSVSSILFAQLRLVRLGKDIFRTWNRGV